MRIELDMTPDVAYVNPEQICYAYVENDGTRCIEMANGDRLFPTADSYNH